MHLPPIFTLPLAIPFWIAFWFTFMREGRVVSSAMKAGPTTQDAGTFRMLMIASPLVTLVAVALAFVPWLVMANADLAVAAGIVLMLAGAWLRRRCLVELGASFTGVVRVLPGQAIVCTGPYRRVRHPSYTAAILIFSGVGVALASWPALALIFAGHVALYGRRIAVEEQALVETLGQPYRDYMARTHRFIPGLV
ncbi:MAG: isoprenylcysteine carboxylmethyltransferase family protein [Burkholderiales bacterium]|nr:isoprenylcysteine carboxylmethyltransferase family protein [Burkholderiales bacterium]